MITLEDYRGLSFDRRRALTVLTFWTEPVDAHGLMKLMTDEQGNHPVAAFATKALNEFRKKDWVALVSQRGYYMEHPVAREAYEEMIREADEKSWWPSVKVAGKQKGTDLFPELHRTVKVGASFEVSDAMLLSEGVRLLACGSGEKASHSLRQRLKCASNKKAFDTSFARAMASAAANRFSEEPNFHLSAKDPLLGVLPAWFSTCFVEGRSFVHALENLNRILLDGGTLPTRLCETYCALCVWSGRFQLLTPLDGEQLSNVCYGCRILASSGAFSAAERYFKKSEINDNPSSSDSERDYDNLPVRFLMAMVSALVKPEKLAMKRPVDLMRLAYGTHADSAEFYFSAKNEERRISKLCYEAACNWKDLGSSHLQIDAYEKGIELCPVPALLAAWDYHQMTVKQRAYPQAVRRIWDYAKEIDRLGWSSYTNLVSALLTGGYDRAAEEAYLRDLDGRSLHFLQRNDPPPEWKGLLEALRKSIPKKKNASADGADVAAHLIWYVSLSQTIHKDVYVLDDVRPATRFEYAPEDGSEDMVLDEYELQTQKVRKLMSERDFAIEGAWYGGLSNGKGRESERMKYLCGTPNLVRREKVGPSWSWVEEEWGPATPMSLEHRTCEFSTTVGEDGGLVLQVPEWALDFEGESLIRHLGGDKYAYVEISKEAKKILKVFSEHGVDGRISIPREGLQQAEAIVEGLSSVMSVAEPTEGTEDLRRVPAASDIRLRMDYSAGQLLVRAVIQPLAENPNLTLDPASGPIEKLVVGAVASFVLVRDLAAEEAAFAPVRAAMGDFESAFDGKCSWLFDDIADAIAALKKLKELGDRAPLEWVENHRLTVSQAPKSGVKLTSQRTADDWFRVDGSFELDDGRILSIVSLLEAARSRRGNFVKLSDGDYLALTSSMAKELDALNAAGRRKGDGIEIVKAAIPMLDGVFGDDEDAIDLPDAMAVTAHEIRTAFAKRPEVPRTLNAELRPYQESGYRWLSRLAACGFGSCLADDMGLGKTIQVISLLLERANKGASLVIAPSSVCGNWRRELERFAPTLRPIVALEERESLSAVRSNDVVIVSYGYLLFHEDEFAAVTWNGLVLDEAQAIKNDASKRAKAVKRLHAKFRVAATGTPVENRLGELWSLFDFLNPGLLGPAGSFAQRFTVDGKAVPELKRLVKPLILRRLKGDVLDDLPDKTEVTISVVLGEAERTAYEACRQQALAQLAEKAEEGGAANRMSILAELTRLRRFCCHPSLVLPGMGVPSAKMEALVELLEGLHEGHHRALVFSQFTDYLALVRKTIDAHKWTHLYLDGSTPTLERERLVNAFQGGEGDFFLISLKAGGTGLNLTAANYVILLDPWWNPAVENQAADRAHRIGQKNPVTVYRLISSDTVEARVIELHQEKKAIAEDVLEGTSSTSLSPAQLMKLFG